MAGAASSQRVVQVQQGPVIKENSDISSLLIRGRFIIQVDQIKSEERGQPRPRDDKLRHKLNQRLLLNNIHRELALIASMNKHLEIPLPSFMAIDLLQKLPKDDVLKLVLSIPFLRYVKQSEYSRKECIKLEYENAQRMILVTGIQRPFVENMVERFGRWRKSGELGSRTPHPKISVHNTFWISVETSSEEAAGALKKYLRGEKRNMDESNSNQSDYKIHNRRVRIIIVKQACSPCWSTP